MVTKRYGEEEFAKGQYLAQFRKINGRIGSHWHDFYEIELVISGEGDHEVNGENYPFCRGSLYLLTPMDNHAIAIRGEARLYHLSMSAAKISPYLHDGLWGAHRPVVLEEKETEGLISLFELLIGESERKDTYQNTVIQNALELIVIQTVRAVMAQREPVLMKGLQRAVAYIQSNFTHPLSLAAVAAEAGMNRTWFSEVFEREMGRGFSRYLTDLRVTTAKRLLRNEEWSIKEICYECGFSSMSTFLYAFRKTVGMTPTEFRKNKRSSA